MEDFQTQIDGPRRKTYAELQREDFQSLIAGRRDGKIQTRKQLQSVADAAAHGLVPDYQLAAWLMAAYLKPLKMRETIDLTLAMAATGIKLDLSSLPGPHVDKHSTGGVGDKTTLVLLPLLAACGLCIVKMSGAGLGITGGTLDKLQSIPGFDVTLSSDRMISQAQRIGIALSGQTDDLAPADKALYGLRDATATTDSMPLIVSSILSKKVAGGAKIVMLDVKCGSGGFMPTLEKAQELAKTLRDVGNQCGLEVRAEITDMSQPLGCAVGNALEVAEALGVLSGGDLPQASKRFRTLCRLLATATLVHAGLCSTEAEASEKVERAISSGRALEKCEQWIAAQGGPGSLLEVMEQLPVAPVRRTETAERSGWLQEIDARTVGESVIDLGGGRKTKGDTINPAVGIEFATYVGRYVKEGDTLFTVHARDQGDAHAAARRVLAKFAFSEEKVEERPLILETI